MAPMRIEIREKPHDLYAALVLSTLLVAIIILDEVLGFGSQVLRVVLGLPFILFIPGYMLISALYPERKRYFDREGRPITREEWERIVEEGESEEGGGDEIPGGKGLDDLERVALSLGLSIAITPLIGLVLNYTYDWDPEHLGIRLFPILISIYAFIVITGIAAILRRRRVPKEDRYGIVIDISIPDDYSTTDKLLTAGIVIMMLASVTLLVYIIVVPREGEAFTEFYILGPTGMAEKYPRNMLLEEEKYVIIGIGNHEHRRMNYTIVLTISPEARNNTVTGMDHVTLSRTNQPSMEISVGDRETLELPCNFSVLETGSYKLRFLLFRGEKEYRDLHIWIKVFSPGRFSNSTYGLETFITGWDGDPSGLPDSVGSNETVGVGVGVRNPTDTDRDVQVRIRTGDGGTVRRIDPAEGPFELEEGVTLVLELHVNATSSVDVMPIGLVLPDGSWTVSFLFDDGTEEQTVSFSIDVGG
ncbi:hypothetical protein B6U90_02290 [Thermoplasmatales archaeon ex4484_6]|nr:MAG: hypothetical protein B6U90_02290 [Thermoplasmatales archaeon ex4484_6]RLF68171.1 MAG: hypothetical protein DRN57_04715 [Thermoplasmata archaeon]